MKGKSSECMAGDVLNREPTMVPRMASASQDECVRYVFIFCWTTMDVFTFTGWRDYSSNWTLLRDLNESIWIKVAEYAVAHKLLE